MKIAPLLLSAALIGCGTKPIDKKPDPKTSEGPKPASTQAASLEVKKDEELRTDYLVVVEQRSPASTRLSYKTVWIKATAAGFEELSSHDGVAASDGERVWFWSDKPRLQRTADCSCAAPLIMDGDMSEESLKKCLKQTELQEAAFYDTSGKERVLGSTAPSSSSAPASSIEDDLAEVDQSIGFIASAGPFLFYSNSGSLYACGAAHGNGGTSYEVVDLRSGAAGSPMEEAEQKTYAAPHAEKARAIFCSEGIDEGCLAGGPAPDITAIFPVFSASGMKTTVQYTVGTSYAATDGLSSSYTHSARVSLEAAPPFLQGVSEVPAAVKAYWSKYAPGETAGWSAVSGSPKALDATREAFARAPTMSLRVAPK